MKKFIKTISLLAFIILLVLTTACSNKETKTTDSHEIDKLAEIVIKGLKDGDQNISIQKVKEMEYVSEELESISSSGEIIKKKVKGIPLENLLGLYGVSQKNYDGIRFIAGDSYSIVVPKEIFEKKDIILAYEVNDEPLNENSLPLMSAIPDERSMYWVKNLMEIELLVEEQNDINKMVFLETAIVSLDQEDYTYYESNDKAVKVMNLFKAYSEDIAKQSVHLKAVDGLEKDEDEAVLKAGYIKITGKDIPMFLSPELPKGMYVKNMLYLIHGNTTYFSLNQAAKACEKKAIEDNEGIALKSLFKEVGIVNTDKYLCTSEDGYQIEIAADDIEKGLIYSSKKGGFTLMFDGMPKNTKVKNILKIEAIK